MLLLLHWKLTVRGSLRVLGRGPCLRAALLERKSANWEYLTSPWTAEGPVRRQSELLMISLEKRSRKSAVSYSSRSRVTRILILTYPLPHQRPIEVGMRSNHLPMFICISPQPLTASFMACGGIIIISMSSKANPWEVLALQRKIKKYQKVGFGEAMKLLHKLRSLGLDKKMLMATEVTRMLAWVAQATKDPTDDEEQRKFNKMVRFLIKEHKVVLGLDKKETQ